MFHRLFAIGVLSLVSGAVLAAPATLTASGQIVATDTDDGIFGFPFGGAVGSGTPVSISLTYDFGLFGPDTNPDPNVGLYESLGASAQVQVGSNVFLAPIVMLGVAPGVGGPTLTTYSFGLLFPPVVGQEIAWNFSASFEVQDANPSEALPLAPFDPAALLNLRMQYQIQQGFDPNSALNRYDGFAANLTPVPLPAAGWLLFAGVGALASLRRRRGG